MSKLPMLPLTHALFAEFVDETGFRTTAEEKGNGFTYVEKKWQAIPGADWIHLCGPMPKPQ